jgi:hypothetical protein
MMAQLGRKHVAEWILHKGYRCVRRKRLYFVLIWNTSGRIKLSYGYKFGIYWWHIISDAIGEVSRKQMSLKPGSTLLTQHKITNLPFHSTVFNLSFHKNLYQPLIHNGGVIRCFFTCTRISYTLSANKRKAGQLLLLLQMCRCYH